MKIAGCQPDSGNPTVRDERGAYGNVSYGGIRNPLHKLKRCMSETLCLRLRAPYFYPTGRRPGVWQPAQPGSLSKRATGGMAWGKRAWLLGLASFRQWSGLAREATLATVARPPRH